MTGYSKKETRLDAGVLSVEILSENNRYLDLTLNLPEPLMQYTEELKRLITGDLRRGRVRIVVRLNGSNATAALGYNSEVLKKYYWALTELAHELKIEQPVTLQNLLSFPDIFKADIVALDLDEIITQVKTLLSSAVTELVAMRRREGEYLAQDLQNHLEIILSKSDEVEALSRQSRQEYFSKYRQNLAELCRDCQLDENRIIQEAGMLAKKLDITEECTRLRSHVQQFHLLLKNSEPVGKQMSFLAQEMNREISTIGAKSESAAIAHLVVFLKDELEKIREQIQNVI